MGILVRACLASLATGLIWFFLDPLVWVLVCTWIAIFILLFFSLEILALPFELIDIFT